MTRLTIEFNLPVIAARISFLLLLLAFTTTDVWAQEKVNFRATVAAGIGYAPNITQGSRKNSGVVFTAYGELEYGKIVGRLQYSGPLLSTFKEDGNLDGGKSYHGSLGYRIDISEKLFVGLLASGGATAIQYNNGINGSTGDTFTNVSPQVGAILAPAYQFTKHFSVQANLRYYKGFKAGDRSYASDLTDVSVAFRFSL